MNKKRKRMAFVIKSGDNGERIFSFCTTKKDFIREVASAKKDGGHIMVVTNKTVVNGSHSSFRLANSQCQNFD